MPGAEWMYRLLYQRGQLSVGERMYQASMPGSEGPKAEAWDVFDDPPWVEWVEWQL